MSPAVAALLTWLLTVGFGFFLFVTWLARGGVSQHPSGTTMTFSLPPPYFPAPLLVAHAMTALGGLLVWVVYVVTDADLLAWLAFALLLAVWLAGCSMFGRWLGSRRARVAALRAGVDRAPAESHLPSVVVFCHGLFGTTTLVLVLLVALGTLRV